MADDEILTVAQVAAQFHVTAQTVRSWIDSGKLKGGRVGKAYVILRRDVYAMVEQAASERRRQGDHAAWSDEGDSELAVAGGSGGPGPQWTGGRIATSLRPPPTR